MGQVFFGNQAAQLKVDARAIRNGIERLQEDRETDVRRHWVARMEG